MSKNNASNDSNIDDTVDRVLNILNNEGQQEKSAFDESNSLLIGIDSNLLQKRAEEYKDTEKQWVRRNAWLKTAQSILKKKGGKPIRYLTLPALHRLDVSLFLKEGLLEITKKNEGEAEEIYVAAFENDPTIFALMQQHKPSFKLFGCGSIEEVLTDENNKYYRELRDLFPFDIINLDLTTSLTPKHEGPYSKTMEAIETIFDIQQGYGIHWALFFTFRNVPDELDNGARKQLFKNLQDNIDNNPEVLEAFQKRYQKNSVMELEKSDAKKCISQSIVKWLVDRAHQHKFKAGSIETYFYPRRNTGLPLYEIYKHLVELTPAGINPAHIPMKNIPEQSWMKRDLTKCVEKHKCTDVEEKIIRLLENAPTKIQELEDEVELLCKMI
ncbi:hypothetical protein KAX97_00755 [candidate division WOR-3 bacterium]|nr:hypothetical protein [candidate division WOR-3 bacterium]